jgi:hypothetical protein
VKNFQLQKFWKQEEKISVTKWRTLFLEDTKMVEKRQK